MSEKPSNPLLYDAIRERGIVYLLAFRELAERYGETEAISVMRSVSRAQGIIAGKKLAHLAPRDFKGMADEFAMAPDDGVTFSTEIRQLDETGLKVQMMTCPIKDAWTEAGCSDEEICTLLHCASAFDEATLETAGFAYEIELWAPGKEGCCLTKITEKT
ncbi:MAG: L-2-amino-thiazoline-4-carboxylic acid hydrolase [Pseudomonadota bacterium]